MFNRSCVVNGIYLEPFVKNKNTSYGAKFNHFLL